jgi:uncharacterized protein (DUF1330 family)
MAAYIIAIRRSEPRGTAWVEEYRPKTDALIEKHGGKVLAQSSLTLPLLALEAFEKPPTFALIIEFPSLEQAQAWHNDPDYVPLKQLRQANVDMELFVIERV